MDKKQHVCLDSLSSNAIVAPCSKCGENCVLGNCHNCERVEKYLNLPDMREVYEPKHSSPILKAVEAIKNPPPKKITRTIPNYYENAVKLAGRDGPPIRPLTREQVADKYGAKDTRRALELIELAQQQRENNDRIIPLYHPEIITTSQKDELINKAYRGEELTKQEATNLRCSIKRDS